MVERERDDHAVRVHPAPALGQVPEHQQQPVVDALVVGDRERDGEVVGAPRAAVEQLDAELRPRDDPLHEPVVEHREPGGLEHHPADLGAHVRALVVPLPRPHHVAVADQLAAAPAEHVDGPAHEPVDDHEPAVVRVDLERRGGVPLAGREAQHAGERLVPRALELTRVEQVAQVGIGIDEAHARGRHTGVPTRRRHVRTRTSAPRRRGFRFPRRGLGSPACRCPRSSPSRMRRSAPCRGSACTGSSTWPPPRS